MKFSSKISILGALPAFLFLFGRLGSVGSLINTQRGFERYVESEQSVERALSEMYAQGLQMGQALRNAVLDPENPKALDNLKAAQVAYQEAFT